MIEKEPEISIIQEKISDADSLTTFIGAELPYSFEILVDDTTVLQLCYCAN